MPPTAENNQRRLKPCLYYLPGKGRRLDTGLGAALIARGFDVYGRETVGDFNTLFFDEQTDLVAKDLQVYCQHDDARIVANSYGAYLFLNSLEKSGPLPGKVLLLSPVVREVFDDKTGMAFVPPRAGRIFKLAEDGMISLPKESEIHVGELDWQSNPTRVRELAFLLNTRVTVVPDAGHILQRSYVSDVLSRWL